MGQQLTARFVIFQVLKYSKVSNSRAARMMAMDNATTNAYELIKNLELIYNKERQASITKEMLEIVSGAEAMHK